MLPRHNTALRPILDRIKTAVFNILGPGFPYDTVLDLFAGTGSIGLEAASRGAGLTVMVENDPDTATVIERNRVDSRLDHSTVVVQRDALAFLAADTRSYDVIFMDPPFAWAHEGRLPVLVRRALPRLAASGVIVLRVPSAFDVSLLSCDVADRRVYGGSAVLFIRGNGGPDGQ
ncbi:MAG: RsmD family RNA methyltransferase [Planctomycetes bacterium]|nr:RsmD family RNA methyltransferase [Planctomycetota bacterium]